MYRYPETGIIKIVLAGRVHIPAQITEGMKKSGLIVDDTFNSIAPEFIPSLGDFLSDIQNEDDVPEFVCTTMLIKDIEPPPLENSGKSDTGAPRRDPLDAEFVAARRDAACSGCNVNTEEYKDDIADE